MLKKSPNTLSAAAGQQLRLMIQQQALPSSFMTQVIKFYLPLARAIGEHANTSAKRTLFVGLQGCQGSGKSTAAAFIKVILETELSLKTLVVSMDDFYHTYAARQELAECIHPLFIARGVPATHDLNLAQSVLDKAQSNLPFGVPVFDKSQDDRSPESGWQQAEPPIDVLILEGWCVGLSAQADADLIEPVNELERQEDPDGTWRKTINKALSTDYAQLFERLDLLIALQAPSFDVVYSWRLLQEQKLIAKINTAGRGLAAAMTPDELQRFIAHYQRLTEHALATMPSQADYLLYLNEDHSFEKLLGKGINTMT